VAGATRTRAIAAATHESGAKPGSCGSITRSAAGTTGVVFPQKLIVNERVRIAADHAVAGDDIARPNGNARTEAVVRVCLRIIGFGSPAGGLGRRRPGRDQRGQRNRSRERHFADEYLHFTLHLTIHAMRLKHNHGMAECLSALAASWLQLPRSRSRSFHQSRKDAAAACRVLVCAAARAPLGSSGAGDALRSAQRRSNRGNFAKVLVRRAH
jgi:hypothetical protein